MQIKYSGTVEGLRTLLGDNYNNSSVEATITSEEELPTSEDGGYSPVPSYEDELDEEPGFYAKVREALIRANAHILSSREIVDLVYTVRAAPSTARAIQLIRKETGMCLQAAKDLYHLISTGGI
jgi:hypothetical protein